jgi:hypothetical protein
MTKFLSFLGGVAVACAVMLAARQFFPATSIAAVGGAGSVAVPESQVWSLYRSSPFSAVLKVHVGTFDAAAFDEAAANSKHNREVCDDTRTFYQDNPLHPAGVSFWCEQGRSHARPGE